MFSSPDTPGMPAPSSKTAWDFNPAPRGRRGRYTARESAPRVRHARDAAGGRARVAPHAGAGAGRGGGRAADHPGEQGPPEYDLDPMAIGRASKTKVNANMGASPVSSGTDEEVEKLRWAERWGADTVMDLSTGGDLDACREAIIRNSTVPIGTVPIYSMIIGRRIEDLSYDWILETLEHQAKQGVDYFTIHAGVLKEHLPLIQDRLIGIVSRGGSLLAKWMLVHDKQNPMYEIFDDICDIMREYDVSFSLGDGLRPGGLADATDEAQLRELETLAELTERAWAKGCQVMVEGPGHVPFDQIEYNMKVQRTLCHGAPFYVLGPAGHRYLPGLRPHHELHRGHGGGLPRRGHAVLRDAEGAPRPPEEGRREAGVCGLQDRRALGRRGAREFRAHATGTTNLRRLGPPSTGRSTSSSASTRTRPAPCTTRTWTSIPTSAPCADTTGAACGSARKSRSSRPAMMLSTHGRR